MIKKAYYVDEYCFQDNEVLVSSVALLIILLIAAIFSYLLKYSFFKIKDIISYRENISGV
jgi:hypothetical protein